MSYAQYMTGAPSVVGIFQEKQRSFRSAIKSSMAVTWIARTAKINVAETLKCELLTPHLNISLRCLIIPVKNVQRFSVSINNSMDNIKFLSEKIKAKKEQDSRAFVERRKYFDIVATKDEQQARLEVCESCEFHFKPTHQCKKCGCFLKLKSAIARFNCPAGKWPILSNIGDRPE